MTRGLMVVFVLLVPAILSGCATQERTKPRGPQSQEDPKAWNRMQPGEGQGMFGGALQRR